MAKRVSQVKQKVDIISPGSLVQAGEIVESSELVAVEYYSTIPKTVMVNKHEYVFTVQHNVCLGWVQRADVPAVLAIVGGCCNNKRPGVFRLASETNVRIWKTGDR